MTPNYGKEYTGHGNRIIGRVLGTRDSKGVKGLTALGSGLEKDLMAALADGDPKRILDVTKSSDFEEAFEKIYAQRFTRKVLPYGDDSTYVASIPSYLVSEKVRREVIDFCTKHSPEHLPLIQRINKKPI